MRKKYYEFNDFEYYGLVTVTEEYEGEDLLDKAFKVYLETIAGESIEQLKEEGTPHEISLNSVLDRCYQTRDVKSITTKEFFHNFIYVDNTYLLVDGGLI